MAKEIIEIARELEAELFTPEFFLEDALIKRLLTCSSSRAEYEKIVAETKPEIFRRLFVSASFNDVEAKKFNPTEMRRIFDSLPTLTGSDSAFI